MELGQWEASPVSGPLLGPLPLPSSPSLLLPPLGAQPVHASPPTSPPQLFLKEHLHQLLESMRERVLHLAALTLQRCFRGFLIRRRFRSLRRKIILLQSQARGYLARCGAHVGQDSQARPELGY